MPFKRTEMQRDVLVDRHEHHALVSGFMPIGVAVIEIFDNAAAARRMGLARANFSRGTGKVKMLPLHDMRHRRTVSLELLK